MQSLPAAYAKSFFTYYNTGMTGIYFSMIKIYKSWQINMVSIFVLFYIYMVVKHFDEPWYSRMANKPTQIAEIIAYKYHPKIRNCQKSIKTAQNISFPQ